MKREFGELAVAAVLLATCASSAAAKDPSVSFKMTSKAPPALERAVTPYQRCVTAWSRANTGRYEDIVRKIDFRNGPPECAQQRRQSEEAGMAALGKKASEAARRKAVRLELLSLDIFIFSGMVWMSQSLPQNQ